MKAQPITCQILPWGHLCGAHRSFICGECWVGACSFFHLAPLPLQLFSLLSLAFIWLSKLFPSWVTECNSALLCLHLETRPSTHHLTYQNKRSLHLQDLCYLEMRGCNKVYYLHYLLLSCWIFPNVLFVGSTMFKIITIMFHQTEMLNWYYTMLWSIILCWKISKVIILWPSFTM